MIKAIKKYLMIALIFTSGTGFGQNTSEPYLFSEDIRMKIDKDTMPWRFQIGATDFSFVSQYAEVLKMWDENGIKKPKASEEDSLYFVKSKKVFAKDYILERSKDAEIVIINEAHHVARHRIFTQSLLQDLYTQGYRYLGLEALFDSTLNARKFPVIESGYYTKEPEFGNMISEALRIGYILFSYEAESGKNGKDREIEQAENIQKFMAEHPKGKILIHCGYAHAFENEYPSWGKAMAGRFKENTGIDPLTIDQTHLMERSDKNNSHLFIRMNTAGQPIVLIDSTNQVFNGFGTVKQTDMVLVYPVTQYTNKRADWQISGKKMYTIPTSKRKNGDKSLIFAYRDGEFKQHGIPADIIEISRDAASPTLFLNSGKYDIIIKNSDYKIIEEYQIEIQ